MTLSALYAMPWILTATLYKLCLLGFLIISVLESVICQLQPIPINDYQDFSTDEFSDRRNFDNFENSPGGLDNNLGFTPQDSGQNRLCPPVWNPYVKNFKNINWNNVDRRCEEGWWHLYPFGERYYDVDSSLRLWHDKQIDLDFFMPYYGFRFNYTFIYPEGFVAFSYPRYIQPPYTFPNGKWPKEPDSSLIAAFMAPQSFMFVGDVGISHVWYRLIYRPNTLIRNRGLLEGMTLPTAPVHKLANGQPAYEIYGDQTLHSSDGRVEDPALLDRITWLAWHNNYRFT